ncbi:MAG TPA: shikimate kinase, partial [Vicinamibacterales bacterium]|nr:shikimate kinase [Vicinamibacterales bacterium]
MKTDKIYLVGFMGAGKSSVARALGKRLDWKVEDIDARIERAERRDIPAIFREKGEPYFRARER